jgi:hypothetical protein
MRQLVIQKIIRNLMDQSDIRYALELLNDAISEKNWDEILEVKELLLEFLDSNDSSMEN